MITISKIYTVGIVVCAIFLYVFVGILWGINNKQEIESDFIIPGHDSIDLYEHHIANSNEDLIYMYVVSVDYTFTNKESAEQFKAYVENN